MENRNFGYRAPCFSLDRARLDIIREAGFSFDSSRINFGQHPLYGSIQMGGYSQLSDCVYKLGDFFEFEATTLPVAGKNIPISGGGYLRLFPWALMRMLVSKYLECNDLYILYIHPFELSISNSSVIPSTTSLGTRLRFAILQRQGKVGEKIKNLIDLLRSNGYEFTTFSEIQNELLSLEHG